MEALGRNRVFSMDDIEGLKNSIDSLMDCAMEIGGKFNRDVDETAGWAARIPSEAGPNILRSVLSQFQKDYTQGGYEETREQSDTLLGRILSDIPALDWGAAYTVSAISNNVKAVSKITEELQCMLKPDILNLSFEEYCERAEKILSQNQVLSEEDKMKQAAGTLGFVQECAYAGDPVNVATGNFLLEETDFRLPGIPLLTFKRSYDSLNREKGLFGRGWTSSFEMDMNKLPEGKCLRTEDGYLFTGDEMKLWFSEQKKLTRIEDHQGNGVCLNYGQEGELQEAVSDCGRKLSFHCENRRIVKLTDDTGREWNYGYVNTGLSDVTNPMGQTHSYEYGKKSNRIERVVNECKVVTVENQYDDRNRVIRQTMPDGGSICYTYPEGRNYTEVTFQDGHIVRHYYDEQFRSDMQMDEQGNLIQDPQMYRYQDLDAALAEQLTYECDDKGNVTRIRRGNVWDEISYGSNGCPDKVTLGEGCEFQFIYDSLNRIIKRIDGNGNARTYEYDNCDRLTGIGYPDGSRDEYRYDVCGNIISYSDHAGRSYEMEYDALKRVIAIKEGERRILIDYDQLGRIEKVERAPEDDVILGENNTCLSALLKDIKKKKQLRDDLLTEEYDLAGNIIKQSFLSGKEHEYVYDCMNRLTCMVENQKSRTEFRYEKGKCVEKTDALGNRTTYEYDQYGKLSGLIDGIGNYFLLKDRQKLISINEKNEEPVPKFEWEEAELLCPTGVKETRDEGGRLVRRDYPGGTCSIYEYSEGLKLKRIVHAFGTEILDEFRYTYDKAGNCVEILKYRKDCIEDSGHFTYSYDSLGRLIEVQKDEEISRVYRYDKYGNRIKKSEKKGDYTYSYDTEGRLCYTNERIPENPKREINLYCRCRSREEKEYLIRNENDLYYVIYRTLPEAAVTENEIKYLLTDHLGSVIRVVREDGSTESVHSYDEFGICTGVAPHYAGYAGYIPATEEIYATESRYYVPSLGRFLTRDSWKGNIGNPQTWNQWIYVLNNPLRYKDVSGFLPEELADMPGVSGNIAGERIIGGSGWQSTPCGGAVSSARQMYSELHAFRFTQCIDNLMDQTGQGNIQEEDRILLSLHLNRGRETESFYADQIWRTGSSLKQVHSRQTQLFWLPTTAGENVAFINGITEQETDLMLNKASLDSGNVAGSVAITALYAAISLKGCKERKNDSTLTAAPVPGPTPGSTVGSPKAQVPAKSPHEYITNFDTMDSLMEAAVNGREVTEEDIIKLPPDEQISIEEFEQQVKVKKIEKWSDPEYVLTDEEVKEAKAYIKEFRKTKYSPHGMKGEVWKEYCDLYVLECKTSVCSAFTTGVMKALIPFWEGFLDLSDDWAKKLDESAGVDTGYSASETARGVETQHPVATFAGEVVGNVITYGVGVKVVTSIPVVGKAVQAAGKGIGKIAGALGANGAVQSAVAQHSANILADTAADVVLDTAPQVIEDVEAGKSAPDIVADAAKNVGENLAFNVVSETIASVGSKAIEAVGKGAKTSYGKSIELSEQRMYQQGQHYNKHGRDMGYSGKKEYEQAARDFFEQNRNTAEIYEGVWNSSRGGQSGQIQIIIRQDGKQLIINKETGQIIDFYEGTSLEGFINIERVQ